MAGDGPPAAAAAAGHAAAAAQQEQANKPTTAATTPTATPRSLVGAPMATTTTATSAAAAAANVTSVPVYPHPPPLQHPPLVVSSPLRPAPESSSTTNAATAAAAPSNTSFVPPARGRSSSSATSGVVAGNGATTAAALAPPPPPLPLTTFQRSRSVGAGLDGGLTATVTTESTATTPIFPLTPRRREHVNNNNNTKDTLFSARWRRRVALPRRWQAGNNKAAAAVAAQRKQGDDSRLNYGSILNEDDEDVSSRSRSESQTGGGGEEGAPLMMAGTPRISNAAQDDYDEEDDDDDEFGLFVSDGGQEDETRQQQQERRCSSQSQSSSTIIHRSGSGDGSSSRRLPGKNRYRSSSSTSMSHHDDDDEHATSTTVFVQRFEGLLRLLWIISGAFILGSCFPDYSQYAAKLAEYTVVAWVTCIVILLVARIQDQTQQRQPRQQRSSSNVSRRQRRHYETGNVHAAAEAEAQLLPPQERTALLSQSPAGGLNFAATTSPSREQQQLQRQQQQQRQRQAQSRGGTIRVSQQHGTQQQVATNNDDEEETFPLLPYDVDEIRTRFHDQYVHHGRQQDDVEARTEGPMMDGTVGATTIMPTTPAVEAPSMSAAETARRRADVGGAMSSSSIQNNRKRSYTTGSVMVPPLLPPRPPTMVTTTVSLLLPPAPSSRLKQKMVHPSLDPYFIIEHSTGRRVYPNDPHRMLFPMDTDYFTGQMMVFIRTPDVDEQPSIKGGAMSGGGGLGAAAVSSTSGNSLSSLDIIAPTVTGAQPSNNNAAAIDYLANKQRRFEFQWQVRLKKVPTDRVYFSCELERPVKMGLVQRAFVGAAMAFVKSTNNSFHYSISGSSSSSNISSSSSKDGSVAEYDGGSRYTNGGGGGGRENQDGTTDGRYEKPHMAFPVEEGMNRIVVTPPGQPVPQLGQEIFESDESIKRRKKGGRVEWNLQDTYTFSLWSAYCDFIEWRCQNLPGIRPFSLNSVIGAQSINLLLYEIPEENDRHMRCDMKIIAEFEMSNIEKSSVGRMAKQWQEVEYGQQDNDLHRHLEQQQEPHNHHENDSGGFVDAMMEQDLDVSHTESVEGEEVEEEMELADLDDDESTEEEAAAELGAGIYVQSGDRIALRESNFSRDHSALEDDIAPCFVTTGGGFAVLQEQSSSTIIIEKRGRRRSRSASAKLIKSGDTVSFKLVTKGRKGEEETRYLSIHRRGWYLSWVSTFSKNGYFTIHTHETEFSDHGALDPQSSETQSSFLSFGGSFWLRSRRWSKFSVGVAAEGSATYGGRMLGLYKAKESSPPFGQPEDDLLSDDGEERLDVEEGTAGWMKPLQLRAYEVSVSPTTACTTPANVLSITTNDENEDEPKITAGKRPEKKLRFFADDNRVDAPVWVEIMNRTERTRQLAYVVRVVPHDSVDYGNPTSVESTNNGSFVRLRTGQELAEVMRLGLSWRNNVMSPRKRKATSEREFMTPENKQSSSGAASVSAGASSIPVDTTLVNTSDHGASFDNDDGMSESPDGSSSDEAASDGEFIDVADMADGDEGVNCTVSDTPLVLLKSPRKGRKLIGKLAKTVKTKTTETAKSTGNVTKIVASSTGKAVTSTGKAVVRHTVKVGKGTMAIIPIRTKNPPLKEPNQKTQRRATRRTERDLHVPVRSMRRLDRQKSNVDSGTIRTLAGELSAPEQSCRTVSNMLVRMSSLPRSSTYAAKFNSLLATQMENESELDQWFLQGGAMKLGVVPNKANGELLCEAVVARCLWESHWREEWCGLYAQVVVLYASLTNTPCLELALLDIQRVRVLETSSTSPLPGYGVLVLETAWLCHYIAFKTEEKLQMFKSKVEAAIKRHDESEDIAPTLRTNNLRSARFWQGFRSSIKSSSSQGKGKWADVSSGAKTKPRIIFNNRRMVFDLFPTLGTETSFVEDLLSMALSFSFDSLLEDPQILVQFLDAASQLRNISIHSMNFESHETFCLFANLYHCLLQHAMLLTVSGPLTKRSCVHFMRTTCYEIGGDVFSLAELQCCVIRGRTSRPSPAKPPYIDCRGGKSGAFRYYSLGFTSPRVNFLINSGDVSCPRTVMILHPDALDEQLTKAAQDFVNRNVTIDESKRIIYIPKVCEVYRSDFIPDSVERVSAPIACLRYCMGYMHDDLAAKVQDMWTRGDVTVKYQSTAEQYHSSLRMKTMEMQSNF